MQASPAFISTRARPHRAAAAAAATLTPLPAATNLAAPNLAYRKSLASAATAKETGTSTEMPSPLDEDAADAADLRPIVQSSGALQRQSLSSALRWSKWSLGSWISTSSTSCTCREPLSFATEWRRPSAAELGFRVTQEDVVFSRWLDLRNRTVRFPAHDGRQAEEHEFDIAGHPRAGFRFVVVLPFHPAGPGQPQHEVTVLREYCQGVNEMMYVLPSGAFDAKRHSDAQAAAAAELSEEGVPETKWCQNRMRPWLCIDPEAAEAPGEREAEEFIEVHRMTIPDLKGVMRRGEMMLPSISTAWFALDELEHQGLM